MRLLKPSWLHHDGNPIFSIDIHPDDTRVVTGGQGNDSVGRVVIWNMQPILSNDDDLNVPKLLCQLDHHNACVNCVRWSNSGKYLCSGGDDRVIIIWKLVSKYNANLNSSVVVNSAFGKTNLEQWKTLSMLRGHTGDILDLAWSPHDKYLASASVDNTVIVWDAMNFPQIVTTITGHNSMVKGVTWDPVGKYLATQSDDKTLKVWRVSDWEMESSISDPFLECGGTTHVLRLDWSPDGSYLVSAHAMNGGGPTAQIIDRADEWKTDKDFVGHRKAVVCVKFNGNIMHSDGHRMKHCCVALGSRDRSLSIWSTALKRPLVVIKDLFTNSVMDLSWSSCGTLLMACSWDGTVALARFSFSEIGKPLSSEETANFYHKTYGKSVTSTEASSDIIQNLEVFLAKRNAKQAPNSSSKLDNSTTSPSAEKSGTNPKPETHPQLPPQPPKGPTDKQIETRTADGRRRITPKFLLPPADTEMEAVPQSEQTVFMQGKGKEDVIASKQATVHDLRKSMVSSIENVKGFTDTSTSAPTNNKSASHQEAAKGAESNNNNEVEVMEIDEDGEVQKKKGPEAGKKLVNGNGLADSGEERKKTDETAKEKLVNGDGSAGIRAKEPVIKSKNGVVVNGTVADGDSVKIARATKEKSPAVSGTLEEVKSKEQTVPVPVPVQTKDGVNLIPVRKKSKHELQPPEMVKPPKKVKLLTPGTTGEAELPKLPQSNSTPHAISGSSFVLPPQRSLGGSSPSKAESSKGHHHHHRLPPMKIESVLNIQVEISPDCSYSLQVTNHYKRPDGMCHQIVCVHSSSSLNGLEWTVCTDAPVCGISGDMHRIVILCENSTVHLLDIKGRYAFPPMVLSGYPSKSVQSGPFLAVVTTKAIIHVWNTHQKRVVLKSESLVPLLNQGDSEKERALDIARITVAAGGLPIIVLNTGKTFMYSFELTTWLLIADPRGLVSSPLTGTGSDQLFSSRMMLFSGEGRLRTKPEPAIITHIKLKLATSTEMKNAENVKQWTVALAKSLATHGLKKELHQLCEDLLGPTHSAARMTTKWNPTMVGTVDKRKLLRQILALLLEDLKYQDFYSEFDELLREVEEQNAGELLALPGPSNPPPTT